MSVTRKFKKVISEEAQRQCFYTWVETGSLEKAQKKLIEIGCMNPRTEKPYVTFSVWYNASLWMLNNSDEARALLEEAENWYPSTKEWHEFLVKRSMKILLRTSRSRFFDWIEKMDFWEYEYLFSDIPRDNESVQ